MLTFISPAGSRGACSVHGKAASLGQGSNRLPSRCHGSAFRGSQNPTSVRSTLGKRPGLRLTGRAARLALTVVPWSSVHLPLPNEAVQSCLGQLSNLNHHHHRLFHTHEHSIVDVSANSAIKI